MFQFNNKIDTFKTKLVPGNAQFVITECTNLDREGNPLKTKKGDPMLKLKLLVHDCKGNNEDVFVWLASSFPSKIRELCTAVGKAEWFESGNIIPQHLERLDGYCIIDHSVQDKGTFTVVKKFVTDKAYIEAAHVGTPFEDEVPF